MADRIGIKPGLRFAGAGKAVVSRAALAALMALATSAACGPAAERYYFVDLRVVPGISVKATGKPSAERLFVWSDIPMRYELDRQDYVLHFRLLDRVCPCVAIGIESKSGARFTVDPIPLWRGDGQFKEEESGDVEVFAVAIEHLEVRDTSTGVLEFQVKGSDGQVLGTESLPFKIVENGFFYYIDSL